MQYIGNKNCRLKLDVFEIIINQKKSDIIQNEFLFADGALERNNEESSNIALKCLFLKCFVQSQPSACGA